MADGERSTLTIALNGPLSCRVNPHQFLTVVSSRNGQVSRAGIAAVTRLRPEVCMRFIKRDY